MTLSVCKATLAISVSPFPSPRLVTAISRLVSEFCRMVLADTDEAARFHMAAHELAENIAKYSTGSTASLEVELRQAGGDHVMRVRAKNRTSPERLEEVTRRLAEVIAASDPVALYDRLIRQSAPLHDVSGLGLARIRAEGELLLDYAVDGDELVVSVEAPVTLREGP